MVQNLDVFLTLHAPRQIAGHAFGQTFTTNHKHELHGVFGEKHRGLPSRVAASGDNDS